MPRAGLPAAWRSSGVFDAVVGGVANHVGERLAERVENAFVEIGVLSGDFDADVFVAQLGDIANDAWKAPEELLDGHHPNFHHGFLELAEHARLEREGVGEFCLQRIFEVAAFEFRHGRAAAWICR